MKISKIKERNSIIMIIAGASIFSMALLVPEGHIGEPNIRTTLVITTIGFITMIVGIVILLYEGKNTEKSDRIPNKMNATKIRRITSIITVGMGFLIIIESLLIDHIAGGCLGFILIIIGFFFGIYTITRKDFLKQI